MADYLGSSRKFRCTVLFSWRSKILTFFIGRFGFLAKLVRKPTFNQFLQHLLEKQQAPGGLLNVSNKGEFSFFIISKNLWYFATKGSYPDFCSVISLLKNFHYLNIATFNVLKSKYEAGTFSEIYFGGIMEEVGKSYFSSVQA